MVTVYFVNVTKYLTKDLKEELIFADGFTDFDLGVAGPAAFRLVSEQKDGRRAWGSCSPMVARNHPGRVKE